MSIKTITSPNYLNKRINYKDDTFYDQQVRKILGPVKFICTVLFICILIYMVYSILTRNSSLKQKTYKAAFRGEIRSFIQRKRGAGEWMYVDGGAAQYDIEIGQNNIGLQVGDSVKKEPYSSTVFVKSAGSFSWEETSGQQFLLLETYHH